MNKYSFIFVVVRCRDESKIEAIYRATLSLVKERGLAGITMGDISKAASIATGTLYIYFKNKEELIKALFWKCREYSAQYYFAGISSDSPFELRMGQVFRNIIHFKTMHFEVSAFLEQSYHSPFVCLTDLKKKETALSPLFDLFEEGVAAKKIKDIDIELLLPFMFGMINEIVKKAYFTNKSLSAEDIDQLYSLFWNGIKME